VLYTDSVVRWDISITEMMGETLYYRRRLANIEWRNSMSTCFLAVYLYTSCHICIRLSLCLSVCMSVYLYTSCIRLVMRLVIKCSLITIVFRKL
jgi:hypothetical protein